MGLALILLFVVLPLVELYLLLQLAEWTSGGLTFLLVVVTGVVGAAFARHQGWGVVHRIRREVDQGQIPTASLLDAVMIFVAGALLITPGMMTDALGFSLLAPACRKIYRGWILTWSRRHVRWESSSDGGYTAEPGSSGEPRDRVVDSRAISRTVTDAPTANGQPGDSAH